MKLEGISKAFDGRQVLANVTIDVSGKVAVMGPNGAGKTTLLRIAAGVAHPTSGTVESGPVAFVPQDAPLYPELTVAEHAQLLANLHRCAPADVRAAGLSPDAKCSTLSRGQRQRLHLAMALATGATLLLDEPFSALDDDGYKWLRTHIEAYPGNVLMSLHDPALATQLCQQVVQL